jgi:hypothetical protein
MANAFLNSGGAVYIGWSNFISVGYSNSVTGEVISRFCVGYTVDEVMSAGYIDPGYVHAILGYRGDGIFSLTAHQYCYLAIQVPQAPAGGVNVWIDGVLYQSPVNLTVAKAPHTIEVQHGFDKEGGQPGWYYMYTFDHWSGSLKQNPRTAYLMGNTIFIAYYMRSNYLHD